MADESSGTGSFIQNVASAALGPIGSAVIGGIGSLFGLKSSKSAQREANATNLRIAQETNNMNYRIAQETNAFNKWLAQYNNEWTADQAVKMFNMENQYNSPVEQMKRLAEAGINPSVAMAGSLGSAMSTPGNVSAPQGQAIPAVAPTMVPGHVDPVLNRTNGIESFSALAGALGSLAGAYKSHVDARNAAKKINYELDSLLAQARFSDAQASYVKFQNMLDSAFAPFERQGNLDKLKQDIKTSVADEMLKVAQTGVANDQHFVLEVERMLKLAEGHLKEAELELFVQQKPLLIQQLNESIRLIKEQQKTEQSKQVSNNAAARASNAQADQIVELTPQMKEEIIQNIKDKKFGRAVTRIQNIMKSYGIGEAPWTALYNDMMRSYKDLRDGVSFENIFDDLMEKYNK